MTRDIAATLPGTAIYDDCLISSCLKSLFKKSDKGKPGFSISTTVKELKAELEQVNKGGILELSYPYLEAMEQTIPGAAFRYIVVYKKGVPVLFAYFQLYTLSSHNFNLEKNKGFVKGILGFFLKLKKIRVLVAGSALRNDTPCYCFDSKALHAEEAIEVVASAAEKIAAEENVTALILKDIPDTAHVHKWLAGMGYKMPWRDQAMVLDVDSRWESLPGYVAALGRKYKTRANKILASGANVTMKAMSGDDITKYGAQINRLFKEVTNKQSFVLTTPGQEHFAQLAKVYGDDFEFFGFFKESKLLAFYSAFVSDEAYELYYVGFDYEANTEYQLYFNMLFSGLERAIVLGKKQLKLGRTSFDAKASLGAKPVDIDYLIKTSGIPGAVNSWFADYFSSMEDGKWKLRNPFK